MINKRTYKMKEKLLRLKSLIFSENRLFGKFKKSFQAFKHLIKLQIFLG